MDSVLQRFRRKVRAKVFSHIFERVADEQDLECTRIDETIVTVHPMASGAKGEP